MAFAQYFQFELFSIDGTAKSFGQFLKAEKSTLFSQLVDPRFIESIVVNLKAANQASSFMVTIRDPDARLLDQADVVFKDSFLRIDAGGFDYHRIVVPYGMVTDLQPEFGMKDYPILKISGHDEGTILANINPGARNYGPDTAENVARKIAASKGFGFEILDPTRVRNTQVNIVQPADVTDRQVLDELARKLGYIMYVSGGKVRFVKIVKDSVTGVRIAPTANTFYWRMGDQSNLKKVVIKVQKRRGSKYGAPVGGFPNHSFVNVLDKGTRDTLQSVNAANQAQQDLKALEGPKVAGEKPQIFKNASYILEGELVMGDVDFIPGENCEIKGLGKVYSGQWSVMSVQHTWGPEGFRTSFKAHKGDLLGWDSLDPVDIENAEHIQ